MPLLASLPSVRRTVPAAVPLDSQSCTPCVASSAAKNISPLTTTGGDIGVAPKLMGIAVSSDLPSRSSIRGWTRVFLDRARVFDVEA